MKGLARKLRHKWGIWIFCAVAAGMIFYFYSQDEEDSSYLQIKVVEVPQVPRTAKIPLGIGIGKVVAKKEQKRGHF